jgi:hypothetical protein
LKNKIDLLLSHKEVNNKPAMMVLWPQLLFHKFWYWFIYIY